MTEILSPADLPNTSLQVFRSGNSRHYHRHGCRLARQIYERNVQYFATAAQAQNAGLQPCSICSKPAGSAIATKRNPFF